MNQIWNIDATYMKVANLLQKKGYTIQGTREINNGRYIICETDKGNFLIVYKREFFLTFGKQFKNEGATGIGETINRDDLKTAVSIGVDNLIFVYENGDVYFIRVTDFLSNCFKRTNKEGKEALSVSIHELRKFEEGKDINQLELFNESGMEQSG